VTPGVRRYQVLQTAADVLTVCIDHDPASDRAAVWQAVRAGLADLLRAHRAVNVRLRLANEPPRVNPGSGKFRHALRSLPRWVWAVRIARAGFYSDWQSGPAWETFDTTELPRLLTQRYRASTVAAVAGVSMGGLGALDYAARHPGMFTVAASLSGIVHTRLSNDESQGYLGLIQSQGEDPRALWGDPDANVTTWKQHNPYDLAPPTQRRPAVHLRRQRPARPTRPCRHQRRLHRGRDRSGKPGVRPPRAPTRLECTDRPLWAMYAQLGVLATRTDRTWPLISDGLGLR
jgi:hypothetical protein